MESPISPLPVAGGAGRELPAYLSNGVVGLKVRDNPLSPGMTLLSGFSGEHPERKLKRRHLLPIQLQATSASTAFGSRRRLSAFESSTRLMISLRAS
jgi:hypothetical protein